MYEVWHEELHAQEEIRLGEIEAWRVWRVYAAQNGTARNQHARLRLKSWWMRCEWPHTGKNRGVMSGVPVFKDEGFRSGVYAFKTLDDLLVEAKPDLFWNPRVSLCVYGRVLLWGDVVEHEKGYRAEYARIIALDGGASEMTLNMLREVYGLPQKEVPHRGQRWLIFLKSFSLRKMIFFFK